MTFLWPDLLWLALVAVPATMAAYGWLLRRRKRRAVRYTSVALVREAIDARHRLRRHVPPLLLFGAMVLILVALARPAAVVTLPSEQETVILAIDVSLSMRAVDVQPSRLEAAQAAARAFVTDQPRNTRIALVTFAGTAALVQPPTHNREDLVSAIDRFHLQRGTAVGSGILVSLKTLFPEMEFDLRASNPRMAAPREVPRGVPLDQIKPADKPGGKGVQPGSYKSAVIILLTDGQTTTGPDPIEAARMAAERGVRVYTVGFGTQNGEVLTGEGWTFRVRLDEESLKVIASLTGGEYYYAGSAFDLKKVYEALTAKLVLERKETEITSLFSAAAAALAVLAGLLSVLWFNRAR